MGVFSASDGSESFSSGVCSVRGVGVWSMLFRVVSSGVSSREMCSSGVVSVDSSGFGVVVCSVCVSSLGVVWSPVCPVSSSSSSSYSEPLSSWYSVSVGVVVTFLPRAGKS